MTGEFSYLRDAIGCDILAIDLPAARRLNAEAAMVQARNSSGRPSVRQPVIAGAVAVLPLFGPVAQRVGPIGEMLGLASLDRFRTHLRAIAADPIVKAVILHIDSPGGGVFGVGEAAAEMYAARRSGKRIVAAIDSLAASAAYWIASQCDHIAITPGGQAGSIGVYAEHIDYSSADAAMGIKTTLISAGRFKTEGHESQPLDDTARAAIQGQVDGYYDQFVSAVARGRDVSPGAVRSGFAEGRLVGAKNAVAVGIADRVATFDDVLLDAVNGRLPFGRGQSRLPAAANAEELGWRWRMTREPPAVGRDTVHRRWSH